MVYLLCLLLFCVGVFGLLTQRNLIKIIISLAVVESAVNIFLVLLSYRAGGVAPIESRGVPHEQFVGVAVDPLPQAMVLTAIVIGFSVLAFTLTLMHRVYQEGGSDDVDDLSEADIQ